MSLRLIKEAVSSPDSKKWLEAMRYEMDSMSNNQVWTLVEPPEGIKPIGCKWVFKKKTDMDGNVQTYKGRLVAKGFRQIHEDVYMTQPEGFVAPENAGKVCKLQRSIYGLKQASRSWNLRFNDAIKEFGFIRNEDEPCVYKKINHVCHDMYKPDLSYALSMTSRYQANPGFVFCLNGGAVSWKSSKQDTVADSTTEAEYIAASEAANEAVWIKKFVIELGVVPSISDAMELYCDNNGAIAQAKEPRSHQRSKHILRRFYLIREIIDRGDVEICKVHTDDNIADPLTKPLTQQKHDRHTESLGIRYVSDWS
ncbi:hypothetical protein V6N13_023159 [Hibiscus sabdariffa]